MNSRSVRTINSLMGVSVLLLLAIAVIAGQSNARSYSQADVRAAATEAAADPAVATMVAVGVVATASTEPESARP
ncbi:MAG: hypothetical protein ACREQZ_00320 [Woeseiaceae bacterium]